MNFCRATLLLAGVVWATQSHSLGDDLLSTVSSVKIEFSEDFESDADIQANGTHRIPDHLNWSIFETDNKLKCQVFQEIASKNVLYREFGYDGDRSFLFRPSDSGKMIIKKGYYPPFQNFLDLRNPLNLLFGNEYFSCKGREKYSSYVPLLGELKHSVTLPKSIIQLDPKSLNLKSPLIAQTKNLVVMQENMTTMDQFLGPSAKASTLVSVIDPQLKFPIAWIRKSTGIEGDRSISYEVMQTQLLKNESGQPLIIPFKSKVTYKLGTFILSQVTFTISKLRLNSPDIEDQIAFDPSSAAMLEDVDAGTIIPIPQ